MIITASVLVRLYREVVLVSYSLIVAANMALQDVVLLAACFLGFVAIGLVIMKITGGVKERPGISNRICETVLRNL